MLAYYTTFIEKKYAFTSDLKIIKVKYIYFLKMQIQHSIFDSIFLKHFLQLNQMKYFTRKHLNLS